MKLENKTVLITGGASGIGKIMAEILLLRNNHVILWDINKHGLETTLSELSGKGKAVSMCLDISDITQLMDAIENLRKSKIKIDVLINNAGIIKDKYFQDNATADIIKTFHVNTLAPIILTHEILRDMLEDNSGHICNIASSAGIISNPGMAVYAGSKWAIAGWSDSLRLEMEQQKKAIRVTTVMPYYINTGMFDGVKSRIPILDPVKTAAKILSAIEKDKKLFTVPGYLYKITRIAQGIFPVSVFDFLADRVFGIYHTMQDFKGRKNN